MFDFKTILIFAYVFLFATNVFAMNNSQAQNVSQDHSQTNPSQMTRAQLIASARQSIDRADEVLHRKRNRLANNVQNYTSSSESDDLIDEENDTSEDDLEDNEALVKKQAKKAKTGKKKKIENESKPNRLNAFYSSLNFLDKAFIIFF